MSALTTESLDLVVAYAAPLHPADRDAFIDEVVARLAATAEVGPGLVHRVARDAQAKFVVDRRAIGVGPKLGKRSGSHYGRDGYAVRPRRRPA